MAIKDPPTGPLLSAEESERGAAGEPDPAPKKSQTVPMTPEGRNPATVSPTRERVAATTPPGPVPFKTVTTESRPVPEEPKPAPASSVDKKGPLPTIANGPQTKFAATAPDQLLVRSQEGSTATSLVETAPREGRESALLLALRSYLEGRPADAVHHLGSYDQTRQDLLLGLFAMEAGIVETSPKNIDEHQAANLLHQIDSIRGRVEPLAPLIITKLHFLRDKGRFRFLDFGKFNPLPTDNEFCTGDFVWIYAEVQNYQTLRRDQDYLVHLVCSVTILDGHGKIAYSKDFPEKDPDPSLSPRRDIFKISRFMVPVPFEPGAYTLRLTVRDVLTKRTAQAKRDFFVTPSRGPYASQPSKSQSMQ